MSLKVSSELELDPFNFIKHVSKFGGHLIYLYIVSDLLKMKYMHVIYDTRRFLIEMFSATFT